MSGDTWAGARAWGAQEGSRLFGPQPAVVHQDLRKSRMCQMKDCGRPGGRLGGFQRIRLGRSGRASCC